MSDNMRIQQKEYSSEKNIAVIHNDITIISDRLKMIANNQIIILIIISSANENP